VIFRAVVHEQHQGYWLLLQKARTLSLTSAVKTDKYGGRSLIISE